MPMNAPVAPSRAAAINAVRSIFVSVVPLIQSG
jgi:hypothetical protein